MKYVLHNDEFQSVTLIVACLGIQAEVQHQYQVCFQDQILDASVPNFHHLEVHRYSVEVYAIKKSKREKHAGMVYRRLDCFTR